MFEKTRIGIIGVGRMGDLHLRKFRDLAEAEVVGIFDTNDERANQASAQSGIPRFHDISQLLFESDAVVVATPTNTHFSLVKRALDAGVGVLVEKPMTEDLNEARELARLSKEKKLVLQVGFLERFRLLELTQGLPLSSVRYVECDRLAAQLGRDLSTDVVTDLMIHDMDLVLSLLKEEPESISAIGIPVTTDRFDLANVRLDFPSGAVANLNASRVSLQAERRFRIFTESSYTSVDFLGNTARSCIRSREGKLEQVTRDAGQVDALRAQAADFIDCVRNKRAPKVSAEDGLRALIVAKTVQKEIAERVSRSGWAGRKPSVGKPELNQ